MGHGRGSARVDNGAPLEAGGGNSGETAYASFMEKEPNDSGGSVMEASLPFLVEGTIDRPGDVDTLVSFRVKPGEKLSFELETPEATLPDFNPRWAVLDESGRVVLSNVYRRVVRQLLSYSKTIEPDGPYLSAGGNLHLASPRYDPKERGSRLPLPSTGAAADPSRRRA